MAYFGSMYEGLVHHIGSKEHGRMWRGCGHIASAATRHGGADLGSQDGTPAHRMILSTFSRESTLLYQLILETPSQTCLWVFFLDDPRVYHSNSANGHKSFIPSSLLFYLGNQSLLSEEMPPNAYSASLLRP